LNDVHARRAQGAPRQKLPIRLAFRHLAVTLDLLAFALVLAGGVAALLYLNRIGGADARLYDIGVESLGVMAEMREEFNTLPTIIRDMVIEAAPDRMGSAHRQFNIRKGSVADKLGLVREKIRGHAEKERLAGLLDDQLAHTWARADECLAICLANRKQEAMLFLRQQVYPFFQASQKAMGVLQESMKDDAASQVKSNRATITWVSVAMAVCTVAMAMLALFYAGRMAKHVV
jgi:hypothetical protein